MIGFYFILLGPSHVQSNITIYQAEVLKLLLVSYKSQPSLCIGPSTIFWNYLLKVMVVCGGSYRRGKASCGDLDVVITHPDGKRSRSLFLFYWLLH